MRVPRGHRRPEAGAAAVEFAIVSVLLLTLVFGIVQYGYYFFQMQAGTAAAREAARLAAVGFPSCEAWRDASYSRASGTSSPVNYRLTFDPTKAVGNRAVVTVSFAPQRFGLPFVPIPGGDIEQTAKIRVEQVNSSQPDTCDLAAP